jgi:hypothetical protein
MAPIGEKHHIYRLFAVYMAVIHRIFHVNIVTSSGNTSSQTPLIAGRHDGCICPLMLADAKSQLRPAA